MEGGDRAGTPNRMPCPGRKGYMVGDSLRLRFAGSGATAAGSRLRHRLMARWRGMVWNKGVRRAYTDVGSAEVKEVECSAL